MKRRVSSAITFFRVWQCGREGSSWRLTHAIWVLTLMMCVVTLTFITSGGPVMAGNLPDPANAARSESKPLSAVDRAEQVVASDGFSAPALFNLGNAWLRAGHPGRAILAYERSLWLAPRDPAVSANLAVARQRVGLTGSGHSAWYSAMTGIRFDTYTWITAVALIALGSGVILWRLGNRPRWLPFAIVGCALTACISLDAVVVRWPELDRGVILDRAQARIAPAASAAVSFDLREGELVHMQRTYGSFSLVRTDDGRTGWVSGERVLPVLASDPDPSPPVVHWDG